jgi:dipeptidyl aminopeptidase/acylaminoacyl peptidase
MTRHLLIKLGIGTAFAVFLALWATSSRSPVDGATRAGEPLVGGLSAALNDVVKVRIVEAGNKTAVTLDRVSDGWTVAERGGYAADIPKVRETLIKLAEAKLNEGKTANPERHALVGVEDVAKAEAKGMRVELEGKINAKVVVGNFSTQGSGTFVRRNDEAQAWLANGNLVLDRDASNWLAKDLLDIGSARIMSVTLGREGESFVVAKTSPEQENFALERIPPGREVLSEFEANGIASVLAGLRFDDVVKAETVVAEPGSSISARFATFDGLVVHVTGFTAGGRNFVSLNAEVDAGRADIAAKAAQLNAVADYNADQKAEAADSAASGDAAATRSEPPEPASPPQAVADPDTFVAAERKLVDEEAAKLNRRVSGWAYVLPAFKYANINKRLEDLLKPKG